MTAAVNFLSALVGSGFFSLTLVIAISKRVDTGTVQGKLLLIAQVLSGMYAFTGTALAMQSSPTCIASFGVSIFLFSISRWITNLLFAYLLLVLKDHKAVIYTLVSVSSIVGLASIVSSLLDMITRTDAQLCNEPPREPWWTVTVTLQPAIGSLCLLRTFLLANRIFRGRNEKQSAAKVKHIVRLVRVLRMALPSLSVALVAQIACAVVIALVDDKSTVLLAMIWDVCGSPLAFMMGMQGPGHQQGPPTKDMTPLEEIGDADADAVGEKAGGGEVKQV